MLKATLNVKENIDVRKFPTAVPHLKSKLVGYQGRKSKILTREDITKCIKEADDERNLLNKAVLILGVSAACRREELVNMTIDGIKDVEFILIIKVPYSKTHSERTLTVSNSEYIKIYQKYRDLRPAHASSR
ncbi:hypothetical protein ILUMI_21010 [Ignelater luminosus]|uniref:Tyr recombinase domain-containing protein n=1 Tax=Ignelater luminosus TaxID=2038154 RepID=A0A8K0FYD5_IGNLU|nr:hypothetical protein ILUMI_21010 [Ignelater luminosus]